MVYIYSTVRIYLFTMQIGFRHKEVPFHLVFLFGCFPFLIYFISFHVLFFVCLFPGFLFYLLFIYLFNFKWNLYFLGRSKLVLVMYLPFHHRANIWNKEKLAYCVCVCVVGRVWCRPIVLSFIRRDWIWMIELMSALMNLNNEKLLFCWAVLLMSFYL